MMTTGPTSVDDESDEELGAWIYGFSRAARATAAEAKKTEASTENRNRALKGSIHDASASNESDADPDQTDGTHDIWTSGEKRAIPAKGIDGADLQKRTCTRKGFTTIAVDGGTKINHGENITPKGLLSREGCPDQARKGGSCKKQYPPAKFSRPSPTNVSRRSSLNSGANSDGVDDKLPIAGARRKRQDAEENSGKELCPSAVEEGRAADAGGNIKSGRWTPEEHGLFLRAVEEHGRDWRRIAAAVETRSRLQVRTHAQKWLRKLEKAEAAPSGNGNEANRKESEDKVRNEGALEQKAVALDENTRKEAGLDRARAWGGANSVQDQERRGNDGVDARMGRWSPEEHALFLRAVEEHGRDWPRIAAVVQTRSAVQVQTHAQKYHRKPCSYEGCTNNARKRGVCYDHGARGPTCSQEGCSNLAVKVGVCIRHGAKQKTCSQEGCSNQAKKGGVCIRHGAKKKHKYCSEEGCSNFVIKGGVCIRHGAKRTTCSQEGCSNRAVKGGICIRHGAKVARRFCSHDGCTNTAVNRGVCKKHGARHVTCSHEGYDKRPRKGRV